MKKKGVNLNNWNEIKNSIIHADNMNIMKDIPDGFFELDIS